MFLRSLGSVRLIIILELESFLWYLRSEKYALFMRNCKVIGYLRRSVVNIRNLPGMLHHSFSRFLQALLDVGQDIRFTPQRTVLT